MNRIRPPFCDNRPGYEDDPDEDIYLGAEDIDLDSEDERHEDDPADWPICDPLWSPQPRD